MSERDSSSPVTGAVLPHAPLLLPRLAAAALQPELEPLRRACASVDVTGTEVVVVLSPHGRQDAVYSSTGGDLSGFGVPGATIYWTTDDGLVRRLADAWGVETSEEPADHGVLVPVALAGLHGVPVVGASLSEGRVDGVAGFVSALREISADHRVAFIASANTTAGLMPAAPLTELPKARELELELHALLESDPGRMNGLAARLASVGGSCSQGTLSAFGALFAGRAASVLAHAWPVGVGYLVAVAD